MQTLVSSGRGDLERRGEFGAIEAFPGGEQQDLPVCRAECRYGVLEPRIGLGPVVDPGRCDGRSRGDRSALEAVSTLC